MAGPPEGTCGVRRAMKPPNPEGSLMGSKSEDGGGAVDLRVVGA